MYSGVTTMNERRSLKGSSDILAMANEITILAQILIFLYVGSCKGDTILPSLYAVLGASSVEVSRVCMQQSLEFGNKAFSL